MGLKDSERLSKSFVLIAHLCSFATPIVFHLVFNVTYKYHGTAMDLNLKHDKHVRNLVDTQI